VTARTTRQQRANYSWSFSSINSQQGVPPPQNLVFGPDNHLPASADRPPCVRGDNSACRSGNHIGCCSAWVQSHFPGGCCQQQMARLGSLRCSGASKLDTLGRRQERPGQVSTWTSPCPQSYCFKQWYSTTRLSMPWVSCPTNLSEREKGQY
jgi:hypothetical protein